MDPTQDAMWTIAGVVAGMIGSAAAVAAAIVAIVTLLALKADSTDRSRPVITAHLTRHPFADRELDLLIENSGASPARDVQITFTPDPLIIPGDKREAKLAALIVARYEDRIPMITPGVVLSNVYYGVDMSQGDDVHRNYEPLPDEFEVHVTYSDVRGKRTYRDTFHLSVELLRKESFSRPGNSNDPQRRLANAIEAIARGIGAP